MIPTATCAVSFFGCATEVDEWNRPCLPIAKITLAPAFKQDRHSAKKLTIAPSDRGICSSGTWGQLRHGIERSVKLVQRRRKSARAHDHHIVTNMKNTPR